MRKRISVAQRQKECVSERKKDCVRERQRMYVSEGVTERMGEIKRQNECAGVRETGRMFVGESESMCV